MPFLTLGFYIFVVIGSGLMLLWLYRGPFFVPTKRKHVPRIIEMLAIKAGEKIVDLGSGDGRLMIAIAEAGGEAHGYEHNPLLVMRSKKNFEKLGLSDRAFVYMSNFWDADVSQYDAVVIYGISYIMPRLERKLRAELRPGARVVSYSFPFPNWQHEKADRRVYLYRK